MKFIIGILIALCFIAITPIGNSTVKAGIFNKQKAYWFCRQVGLLDNNRVMFMSHILSSEFGNYEEKEKLFDRYIKMITDNHFSKEFQPKCRDYSDLQTIQKHRNIELETAKKYNTKVQEIYFNPALVSNKEQS